MSEYWTQKVWETDVPLSYTEKYIALALAQEAGEDGLTWPSAKSLVALTGVGQTKVGLALKAIEESGLVVRADTETWLRLGAPRSIVYQFQGEPTTPPRGEETPPRGEATPRGGYTWTPEAPAPIAHVVTSPTHDVGSPTHVVGSAAHVVGTTKRIDNGDGDDHVSKENHLPRSTSLLKYWLAAFRQALKQHEPEVIGSVNERALGRMLKLLKTRDGMSDEQIKAMINAYMAQPSAWNKHTHPSLDFCSSGTLNRIRTQSKHRDAEPGIISKVPVLTEAMPEVERTIEEEIALIQERNARRFTWSTPKTS